MENKIMKWVILAFVVIVALVYSEKILSFGKKLKYKNQGYVICTGFACMNERMQKCERAYMNITSGFQWVDAFVQGYKDKKCVYQVNKYTGDGYICSFDGEIFSKKLVDEVFGVHNGLRQTIVENCVPSFKK